MTDRAAPKRDPRREPKKGDRLSFPGGIMSIKRTVESVEGSVVTYSYMDGRYRGRSTTNLETWILKAADAKVLHAAD